MDMLHTAENYLDRGLFAQQVVDILVVCAANALNVNIGIYQQRKGKVHFLWQTSDKETTQDIFLILDHQHYEAVVVHEYSSSEDDNV